jgi:hypothetical protein
MIINRDVEELPSDPRTPLSAISRNPVSDHTNPAQFLYIQMQQISGSCMLVPLDRSDGIQHFQPAQT